MEPLYFGCYREGGHYVWNMNRRKVYDGRYADFLCANDGNLAPAGIEEREGVVGLFHWIGDGTFSGEPLKRPKIWDGAVIGDEPFTVIAFWDRSIDRRGKCNSMFLLPGVLDKETAIAEAKRLFPWVFERLKFEVA